MSFDAEIGFCSKAELIIFLTAHEEELALAYEGFLPISNGVYKNFETGEIKEGLRFPELDSIYHFHKCWKLHEEIVKLKKLNADNDIRLDPVVLTLEDLDILCHRLLSGDEPEYREWYALEGLAHIAELYVNRKDEDIAMIYTFY